MTAPVIAAAFSLLYFAITVCLVRHVKLDVRSICYAGVFGWDRKWKVLCGTALAVLIRIAGHVLSGVVFYSPECMGRLGRMGIQSGL